MTPRTAPPAVLVFAASDPTGGAGIQADIMTISALGCHALTAITALTIQDTVGVDDILPIDPDWLEGQARAVLDDMPVRAFKIGLLGSVGNIERIARLLADHPDIPVVLDPVLASGRGDAFADERLIEAIRNQLLPLTTVLTPNSIEARRLTNSPGSSLDECAQRLTRLGCKHVLLTGTHEDTQEVINNFYNADGLLHSHTCARLPGSYHGSGCTIASALAANLALGQPITEAVQNAEDYTWQTLAAGFRPGAGQYIPDRFYRHRQPMRNDEAANEQGQEESARAVCDYPGRP